MSWLALDIGGANLKAADGLGNVAASSFALWKSPQTLGEELQKLVATFSSSNRIAVTMTGELCDCFASKTEGVQHILSAVREAFPPRETWIYLVDGRFVRPEVAAEVPLLSAASNWHALASFAGRYVADAASALLIDVGSTTCDLIPLLQGIPAAIGSTDTTRMLHGELVYTGVERSPCYAILPRVTYREHHCPVAQEFFATMKDAYLLLGELSEDPADCETADGRPSLREHAIRRLGKLICADELEFTAQDALLIAAELAAEQTARLAAAIEQVLASGVFTQTPQKILLSGHGEFLTRAALRKAGIELPLLSLTDQLGPTLSRCAPAHALAVLARETLP